MTILAIARVAALTFWRDRSGLVLAFVLPPVVFLVFAAVFGAGASGRIDVRAGLVDQVGSPQSRRLATVLRARLGGRLTTARDPAALADEVALGREDAGLVIRGDLRADPHPLVVLASPAKRASGEVLLAQTLDAADAALPDVMLARSAAALDPILRLDPGQRRRLAAAAASRSPPPLDAGADAGPDAGPDGLAIRRVVGPGGDPVVVYYAGAVSILFAMFTTMQGALAVVEERRAGLQQRLALSVGGVAPVLAGRMLWLTALAATQALAVFAAAAIAYRTPLLARILPWSVTAIAAGAASAGLSLGLVCVCRTREQAQTVSTFAILILGAVGGSMAPRFLMPAALQALGLATPNAWAIEAYQGVLWRRVTDGEVVGAWLALLAFAIGGFTAAVLVERRMRA